MQKAICEDKESDKEQLKPCPFCGGMVEMFKYADHEWFIHCTVCHGMIEWWRKTEQEAIERWNNRVS